MRRLLRRVLPVLTITKDLRQVCFLLFGFAVTMAAQTFDVASVKEVDPMMARRIVSADISYKGGNLYMRGTTLSYAMEWAFDLHRYQIQGPEWMFWRVTNDQPRFDIMAKTDASTTKEQAKLMAQALLIERFGLKFHYSDREVNGYVLRDDSHGVKVAHIENDKTPVMSFQTGKAVYKNVTIEDLCEDLSLTLAQPTVNRTSLEKQLVNVTVQYEPGKGEMLDVLFEALKQDMGIVMAREKVSVKTLVIDSVFRTPIIN